MKPVVSVIIPIYDGGRFLATVMASVLKQALVVFEVICVDDGSTDNTLDLLKLFEQSDARVKVLHQENAGQGAARNYGLSVAQGKYVYFLDVDDFLRDEHVLAYLVREADREQLDLLFFDAETHYDNPDAVYADAVQAKYYIRKKDYSKTVSGVELFTAFVQSYEYSVSPCLLFIRREFLEENQLRFPEGYIYEDNIFVTRILLMAKRAAHRRQTLYVRCVHENTTVTAPINVKNIRGYLNCYRHFKIFLGDYLKYPKVMKSLWILLRLYKRNLRKMARKLSQVRSDWKLELSQEELNLFNEVMPYPLKDKFLDLQSCYQRNGFFYTIKRLIKIFLRKV